MSSPLVDWAGAGSQADALFFSAPVSLPASGPSTATMISQNTRTAHLVRRPAGIRMMALALLMPRSPFGLGDRHAAPDARWRRLPRECGPSRRRELIGPSGELIQHLDPGCIGLGISVQQPRRRLRPEGAAGVSRLGRVQG